MDFGLTYEQQAIREGVAELCRRFPDEYWRELDARSGLPRGVRRALTEAGWLGALIPPEYGGGGLGIADASIILEEINRQGGNAGACHAQMYIMGTVLRHGSEEQKQRYLPGIASGDLRLQAFGVTEPDAGSNTLAHPHARRAPGRRHVAGERPEDLDLALPALRPDAAAGAHRHARARTRSAGGASRRSWSTCARPAARSTPGPSAR